MAAPRSTPREEEGKTLLPRPRARPRPRPRPNTTLTPTRTRYTALMWACATGKGGKAGRGGYGSTSAPSKLRTTSASRCCCLDTASLLAMAPLLTMGDPTYCTYYGDSTYYTRCAALLLRRGASTEPCEHSSRERCDALA
eukprot:scaffold28687_cov65-Phaeocystis_antarctica.AAC.4